MSSDLEFPILVKRKIPYVSEGVLGLCAVFSCVLFLPFLFTGITGNGAGGVVAEIYFSLMSGWVLVVCFAGLVFFGALYSISRIKRPAILNVSALILHIKGSGIDLTIPVERIKKIYFNDLRNFLREPKGIMQIVVMQKNGQHHFFLLADYENSGKALEILGNIGSAEVAFYDDAMEHMDSDE